MARKSETALQALFALIQGAAPATAKVLRNEPLPVEVPKGGVIILRDGDPGAPEITFSPLLYEYEHAAQLEIVVTGARSTTRDKVFDKFVTGLGTAIIADRTLGGVVDWLEPFAPDPTDLAVDNSGALKAAILTIQMVYQTTDPLN